MFLRNSYYFLVLILISATSCVSKIDLNLPVSSVNEITIQGKLTYKEEGSKIVVNTYKVYDRTGDSYDRVSPEYMYLENEEGEKVEILEKSQGINELDFSNLKFDITPGKAYRLRCGFDELGEVISPWEVVPDRIEDIGFRVYSGPKKIFNKRTNTFVDKHYIFLELANLNFPAGSGGIKYRTDYTFKFKNLGESTSQKYPFCYIRDEEFNNKHQLFKKTFDSSSYRNVILVETLGDFKFEYGCYINMYLESLNENGMDYFEKIEKLNPQSGSLFQRKLGNLNSGFVAENGNIVHGKFYIAAPSIVRKYVSPEVAKVPVPLCPLQKIPEVIEYPENLCFGCRKYGFNVIKPSYWVD